MPVWWKLTFYFNVIETSLSVRIIEISPTDLRRVEHIAIKSQTHYHTEIIEEAYLSLYATRIHICCLLRQAHCREYLSLFLRFRQGLLELGLDPKPLV